MKIFVFLLIIGAAFGGIPIPRDACEWREESYGVWNQCMGNELAVGNLAKENNLILRKLPEKI